MKATLFMFGLFLLTAVASIAAEQPNGPSSGASVSSELPYVSEAVAAIVEEGSLPEAIEDPSTSGSGSSPPSTPPGRKKKVKPPGPSVAVSDNGKSSYLFLLALIGLAAVAKWQSARSSGAK